MTVSSLKGDGMDQWCQWLLDKVQEKKARTQGVAV
jgi:hydrogenase nickel incorporation protein HypB